MLGVGIVIPVIPALFFENDGFFSTAVSYEQRSIMYGFLIAAYPIMQFFGAPMLGAWSDRFGRRPMLLISLIGTFIGYLLFATAIIQHNIYLLYFARALPGFTGGNIAVIFSSIADVSDEKTRTANFGLVGMAFGIGFVIGPALGGFLADNTVVSWFSHATPFWFTAFLSFLNFLFIVFIFRETLQKKRDTPINPFQGIKNIALSFRTPNLRSIFSVILLVSLGFTFFTQFFSVYLYTNFSFTEKSIGLLYGWIGIWLAITQGGIVRYLATRYSSFRLVGFATIGLSAAILLLLFPTEAWWFYLINPLIAVAQGINSPNLINIVSKQASAENQGEIMGINASMNSLGQSIPPIIAGFFNAIWTSLPLIASATLILLAAIAFWVQFGKQALAKEEP